MPSASARIRPVIGITVGDPGGIGPEVTSAALRRPSVRNLANYVVIGDHGLFRRYFHGRFPHCLFLDLEILGPDIPRPGKISRRGAGAALAYLQKAVDLLKEKTIDALVTAPVCKETIEDLGQPFPGHTEFLAEAFGVKDYDMMFVSEELKTIIVTRHIPLKDAVRSLSRPKILSTIRLADRTLKQQFHIRRPRLAICGLNPHAGEGGKMGREEISVVIPAVQAARRLGIAVEGPLAADTLFVEHNRRRYDAVIAMYHDQGLIPVKTLAFRQAVNLTIGLPFVRTSPAHGTAFDIAGKNKADCSSMVEAIRLAATLRNPVGKRSKP